MAFKSNGCNTIWFYIVSMTPDKGGSAMNGMPLLLFLVTFLAVWEFPTSQCGTRFCGFCAVKGRAATHGELGSNSLANGR